MNEKELKARWALYLDGKGKLCKGHFLLGWPKTIEEVAKILEIPIDIFTAILRKRGYRKTMILNEAIGAWKWLCFSSRDPYIRKAVGVPPPKPKAQKDRGVYIF